MPDSGSNPIRIAIPQNGSVAELIIAPVDDPAAVTIDLVIAALRASEVEITQEVRDAALAVLAGIRPAAETRGVIARAQPAIHGEHGRVEWLAREPDAQPTGEVHDDGDADDSARADHYTRSRYIMVTAGDHLGTIHEPVPGIDGRDVRGRRIAARTGKPVRLRLDDSILLRHEDGALIAQRDGILSRSAIGASVRDLLEVKGYVDFSTGNIAFGGDVSVIRGVRDLFVVEAKGNLHIRGLIEAAHLRCGGDCIAAGGMAGRDRGSIRTAGSLTARYLDAVRVDVGAVLRVDREMINCTTTVHERIDISSGAIIGGRTVCTGQIRAAAIGAPAGTPTEIVVYSVPQLDSRRAELMAALESLTTARRDLHTRLGHTPANGAGLTGAARQRHTRLAAELREITSRITRCSQSLAAVEDRIAAVRIVDVRADRVLYTGVRIICGEHTYRIRHDLRGPLLIARAQDGALLVREGEAGPAAPLASVAEVTATANTDHDQPPDASRAA